MKKFIKIITSRSLIVGSLIALEFILLILTIVMLASYFIYLYSALIFLSISISIFIISKDINPMYKISYILPILIFPLFGGILYVLLERRNTSSEKRLKFISKLPFPKNAISESEAAGKELRELDELSFKQFQYILNSSNSPIYKNTYTKILTPGEVKFQKLISELKKAKKFIFLEYFIIEPGKMWDSILEILIQKVKEGVEVRLIYDDIGTINLLEKNYKSKIESYGIKVLVFNPFKVSLDLFFNFRDHRKIIVIDGHTAFTGGTNIADEYINAKNVCGHWKDLSIMIKGEAVWSFTVMFLQIWFFSTNENHSYIDYEKYKYNDFNPNEKYEGFVQPFSDTPNDNELISEFSYINIINNAKKSIYITTPYLILDNEMVTSLCLAAKSGIDVKIITPAIPDKWYVHETTRSNYHILISAGIQIFEYSPGFIHSKMIVCDNEISIVGTANFDYRSFYFHLECGVWMYKTKAINELISDFKKTLILCKKITLEECINIKWHKKFIRTILKMFSPLM